MKTVKNVCSMYGVKPFKRGFVVTASGIVDATDTSVHRYMVWTPTEQNDVWTNLLFDNGNKIIESNSSLNTNNNSLEQISGTLSSALNVRLYSKISDILPALKIN